MTLSGEDPAHPSWPRQGRGQLFWNFLLNGVLVAAFVVGVIPLVAIVHGFMDMVVQSKIRSGSDWVAYGFAFTGLFLGAVFFAYAVKYYLSTVMVLLTTLVGVGPRSGNGGTYGTGANPATFSTTTAAKVTILAGQTLCLKVDLSVEDDDAPMTYDTAAAPTQLQAPVTVVPESALAFLGLALAIPV